MNKILKLMRKRENELKRAIRIAECTHTDYPEGHLRISVTKGRPRFYHLEKSGDTQGKYISKRAGNLPEMLAQKDYRELFLIKAKSELAKLRQSIQLLSKDDAESAYQKLSDVRKNLVIPYMQNDEQFAEDWQKAKYEHRLMKESEELFITSRGDKVRTKAELLLADLFFGMGIPYRYEPAVHMKSGITIYPSFMLLKKSTRGEVYLDHLGVVDNEEGRIINLRRLDEYRNNGIWLGTKLLITYESQYCKLDLKGIRKMLSNFFEI